MEVAPFFVDFHHFLSIFTIFYRFSRFTHFCRDLHFVAIYALFPQIFFGQNSLLRNITRFLHVCCLTVITLLYLITTYVYQGAHLSPNIKCCTAPDIILYEDASVDVCCNNGTCFKDMVNGGVLCHDGLRQTWSVPCNGVCKQMAKYGFTLVSCENGEQCVKEITLCKGVPLCTE